MRPVAPQARQAIRVAAIYAAVAAVWIFFSDRVVEAFVSPAYRGVYAQTLKGLAFVLVTAAILFVLVRRAIIRVERARAIAGDHERHVERLVMNIPGFAYRCRMEPEWPFTDVSPRCSEITGYSREEFLSGKISFGNLIDERDRTHVWNTISQAATSGGSFQLEYRIRDREGRERWVWERGQFVSGDDRAYYLEGVIIETTSEKSLQRQVQMAQRLEAMGRLAAGIAHDFNNLLAVVKGRTQLVVRNLDEGSDEYAQLRIVEDATDRATRLTRQLMTFARRQSSRPQRIDLVALLGGMQSLIRAAVGGQVQLELDLPPQPLSVFADPTQIEQVVMNLVVNARDATEAGGRISLHLARHEDSDWVELTVADTGCGMSEETLRHLFEPMFTTKGEAGSGLGLATTYGIVAQIGGRIAVWSEVGRGSRFTVRLPVHEPAAERISRAGHGEESLAPVVLLAEDDDALRVTLSCALREAGNEVLEAATTAEALEVLKEHAGNLDLIISDTLDAGPRFVESIEQMREEHPDLRVLHITGAPMETLQAHGARVDESNYLPKPFPIAALLERVVKLSGGTVNREKTSRSGLGVQVHQGRSTT